MSGETPSQPQRQTPATLSEVIRSLDWRFELLGLVIILAEAFPVYLLCSLFVTSSDMSAAYPFWIVIMLLLASHLVSHLLEEARVWSPDFELIIGAVIVITLLVAIKFASFPHIAIYDPQWLADTARSLALLPSDQARPVWGTVLLAVYAWARSRFREEPSIDSAYSMLRYGTLALGVILLMVLLIAPNDGEVRNRMTIATIGFFAATLGAVGIARLQLQESRTAGPLGAAWLPAFVAPIGAVVLTAILAAGVFSRQFLDTLLWLLTPVFWVLSLVFQLLILLIAILAYIILTPIFWLIGDRSISGFDAIATPGEEAGSESQPPEPFTMPEPLRYLIAAVVLFVIFSALTRFLFRRRARRRGNADEERESVLDWSDVAGSLADKFKSLLQRTPAVDALAHLRGDPNWRYTLQIREHYARLQRRGQRAGRARRRDETAEDYRPAVGERFSDSPDAPRAVDTLTAIYRKARYSGEPATQDDAETAGDAWHTIEQIRIQERKSDQ